MSYSAAYSETLVGRALKGAGIALLLVIVFLSIIFPIGGVLDRKKFWQCVWQFFPLITATAGGALGGMVFYLIVPLRYTSKWKRDLAIVLSVLVYILLLWFSLIAGFSITGQRD